MELQQRVRQAIYAQTAATGQVPTIEAIASACGVRSDAAREACAALAEAHVIILQPDGRQLWAAPPFSAVQTAFHVHAGGRAFYAPCAWDAFGVPAALKTDAAIEARSAQSGEPLPAGVRAGEAYGEALIHLEVPARRFWDDIIYT